MRLTKLEHSAVVLEQDGQRIVIDPGNMTTPITSIANVLAIVVTHQHPDHIAPEQLTRIRESSPDAQIFGPAGAADAAGDAPFTAVSPGDTQQLGPFRLRWAGGEHAVIHNSIPGIANCGVLVNDVFYHPGDSLWVPDFPVPLLGVPVGAPWLKIGEVMDWVLAVHPARAFGIHEMVLSVNGRRATVPRAQWATEQGGGQYFDLQPDETLDL